MATLITIALCVGAFIWLIARPHQFITIICSIPRIFKYVVVDTIRYIKCKEYNLYKDIGRVYAYCGAFGSGKTLSAVHDARRAYKKYNGKIVFWKGEFRPQVINIYSNMEIKDVPYIRLNSLMDIVDVAQKQPEFDDKNHLHTVSIFLIDEMSSLLNSRNFATNLNFDVVAALLQCRKASSKLMYTAQNFVEVDALIRRNTHYIIQCDKRWRLMFGLVYDAKDVEYALNPNLCKPIDDYGWFVLNSDYAAYDTLSQAMSVDKNKISEDFISSAEAYARLQPLSGEIDSCNRLNHKGKKRQRVKTVL